MNKHILLFFFLCFYGSITGQTSEPSDPNEVIATYKEFNEAGEEVYERELKKSDLDILNTQFKDAPDDMVIKLLPPKKKKETPKEKEEIIFEGAEMKEPPVQKKKETPSNPKTVTEKPAPVKKEVTTNQSSESFSGSKNTYSPNRSRKSKISFWQSRRLQKKSRKKRRARFKKKRCYKFK